MKPGLLKSILIGIWYGTTQGAVVAAVSGGLAYVIFESVHVTWAVAVLVWFTYYVFALWTAITGVDDALAATMAGADGTRPNG